MPAVGVAQVLDPVHPKDRRAGAQLAQSHGPAVGHGGHVAVGGDHDHHPVACCHGAGEGATGQQHLIVGVGVKRHNGRHRRTIGHQFRSTPAARSRSTAGALGALGDPGRTTPIGASPRWLPRQAPTVHPPQGGTLLNRSCIRHLARQLVPTMPNRPTPGRRRSTCVTVTRRPGQEGGSPGGSDRSRRRSRCGSTVYLGSRTEARPASKTPNRVTAEPVSSAAPDSAETARFRRPTSAAAAPPAARIRPARISAPDLPVR
jgi:hypothetical protein